jgi:hypothetical protein
MKLLNIFFCNPAHFLKQKVKYENTKFKGIVSWDFEGFLMI